jgi:hypothetical protein
LDEAINTFLQGKDDLHSLDTILSYSLQKLQQLHERKRHIETKGLYLLQGQAVSIALFSVIWTDGGSISWNDNILSKLKIIIYVLILVCIIISVGTTVFIQKDNLLSSKCIQKILKRKYNIKISDEEAKGFRDIANPQYILDLYYKNKSNRILFEKIIESIDTSINNLCNICISKNYFLNKAICYFIASLVFMAISKFII